jgi:hypothetical protein
LKCLQQAREGGSGISATVTFNQAARRVGREF